MTIIRRAPVWCDVASKPRITSIKIRQADGGPAGEGFLKLGRPPGRPARHRRIRGTSHLLPPGYRNGLRCGTVTTLITCVRPELFGLDFTVAGLGVGISLLLPESLKEKIQSRGDVTEDASWASADFCLERSLGFKWPSRSTSVTPVG